MLRAAQLRWAVAVVKLLFQLFLLFQTLHMMEPQRGRVHIGVKRELFTNTYSKKICDKVCRW